MVQIGIASLLFVINIGLQVADGLLTYYGLRLGFQEGNPLVQTTMTFWGIGWGLVLWKGLACVLLALVYCVREYVNIVPGLVLTACFYIGLSVLPWLGLLLSHAWHRAVVHESSVWVRLVLDRGGIRPEAVTG